MQIRRPAEHRVSPGPGQELSKSSKRRQNQVHEPFPLRIRLHQNNLINAARTKIRRQRLNQDPLHVSAPPSK